MSLDEEVIKRLELAQSVAHRLVEAYMPHYEHQTQNPRRNTDVQFIKKAIEESRAHLILLRAHLIIPATAHIRTLINIFAAVSKLRDGDTDENYERFFDYMTLENEYMLDRADATGLGLSIITSKVGIEDLKTIMETKHGFSLTGLDGWVDAKQKRQEWAKGILQQQDVEYLYMFYNWYSKMQHASPLGLLPQTFVTATGILFQNWSDGHNATIDRAIRMIDYLTRISTQAWLSFQLLSEIITIILSECEGFDDKDMEKEFRVLMELDARQQIKTAADVTVSRLPQ